MMARVAVLVVIGSLGSAWAGSAVHVEQPSLAQSLSSTQAHPSFGHGTTSDSATAGFATTIFGTASVDPILPCDPEGNTTCQVRARSFATGRELNVDYFIVF